MGLERKLKNLQLKVKQNDENGDEDKNELMKFQCILEDFDKECNASQHDFEQLAKIKVAKDRQMKRSKQDMIHLQAKITKSLSNSDKMLRAMIHGLQQI